MDFVWLGEAGCRPHGDPALLVNPAERLVRRLRCRLEHIPPTPATAISARPHVEVATAVGDVLERPLLGHELHDLNVAGVFQSQASSNGLDISGVAAYAGLMDLAFELAVERGAKPLHVAIAEQLAAAIASGRLVAGAQLPPERSLAESIGVSRMTVRQALGELERDGLLRRVVGRDGGTFVCGPDVERRPSGTAGLSAELRRQGLATSAEVISVDIEPCRGRTAAALNVERGERVVVIVRLRLASGKPLAVERSSVPARLFPDIEDMDLGGSLPDVMGEGFGLRPVRAIEHLETVEARPSDARILGLRRGAPILLVERVGYAADGTAVEFARDRFRGDRTRIVLESTEAAE